MNGAWVGTIACSTDVLVVRSWQSAADLLLPGDTALDWTSWKAKADQESEELSCVPLLILLLMPLTAATAVQPVLHRPQPVLCAN